MSVFSPTPQFSKRWLATPVAVKEVFRQELDDIIDMLHGNTPAQDFHFTYPDFGEEIKALLNVHKMNDKPVKLIHSLDTSSTTVSSQRPSMTAKEIEELEKRICDKLSHQIDNFLTEHTSQLADDLKAWLHNAIKNELSEYK